MSRAHAFFFLLLVEMRFETHIMQIEVSQRRFRVLFFSLSLFAAKKRRFIAYFFIRRRLARNRKNKWLFIVLSLSTIMEIFAFECVLFKFGFLCAVAFVMRSFLHIHVGSSRCEATPNIHNRN